MTAQKFLTDFCKDLVAHPMDRQALIAGYSVHLEAMLEKARKESTHDKSRSVLQESTHQPDGKDTSTA